MATIRDLSNELTAPATDDKLVVSDTSAAAGSQDKWMALGRLAAVAFNNVFTGYQSFTGGIKFLALARQSNPVISGGVLAITDSYHAVDTEGGASADDLDTITGGIVDGQLLFLRCVSQSRVVTVKNGTGNIRLPVDRVLDNVNDRLFLKFTGTFWIEIIFSNNA